MYWTDLIDVRRRNLHFKNSFPKRCNVLDCPDGILPYQFIRQDGLCMASHQVGGLFIGFLLDLPWLSRPNRAKLGYGVILVTGFSIWGGWSEFIISARHRTPKFPLHLGGLAFQRWNNATGKKQWLDFSDSQTFIGPFWL